MLDGLDKLSIETSANVKWGVQLHMVSYAAMQDHKTDWARGLVPRSGEEVSGLQWENITQTQPMKGTPPYHAALFKAT